MAIYDSIDLDFTWDGDYKVGATGDLEDTSSDLLLSFKNEIRTVVKSEFNDWELHPNLGANASEFRGEPNTRAIGKLMEDRFRSRLIAAGIVNASDIQVKITPVGIHEVLVTIIASVTATPGNGLILGEPVAISLVYDSLEDSVFFLAERKSTHDYRTT